MAANQCAVPSMWKFGNYKQISRIHEQYRRRSASETWITKVKGRTIAGCRLTDNFWANNILETECFGQ